MGAEVSILGFPAEKRRDSWVLLHLLHPLVPPAASDNGSLTRTMMGTPAGLLAQITPRQQEILRLLAEGQTTHEISEQLHISDVTVRNHVEKLLLNLRVHSRLEAVSLAHKAKLL